MKKKLILLFIIFFGFTLSSFAGDMQGFMNALEKAKNAGFTIDPDATAKEYGYKTFDNFVKEYLKTHKLKDISVDEVRETLLGVDRTIEIVQSQENLDKLYSLILNDKYFKKRNSYFKTWKKGKYKGNQISMMALAVYINYEKEMAKITKNPNLEKVSRFTWSWGYSWGTGSNPYKYALEGCEEDAKKHKLSGGKCIIVDWRSKVTGKIENRLKPIEIKKLENTKFIVKTDDKIFTTDEKYYALVIGNNNYKYLEKLDAAENDAKVLAGILKNNYNFDVELLLNADYETTVDSLHNISKKLKKDDNLLIFYAGHGDLDKKQNRGYWLPVDASYEKRSRWISNATVADELKATDAKHVLLIVDSCFSGSLMRSGSNIKSNKNLDAKYIKLLQKKKTRLVITSGGNEPVMDSDGGLHSVFAQKLIDTLKENKNVISTQKIFENIKKYVAVNAAQTPERAAIYKAGHDGGDFLFFAKN